MALIKGWLYLDYGGGNQMQIPIRDWEIDKDNKPTFIDYPNDGHYGFALKIYKRTVKIKGCMINNKTDWDLFLLTLDTIQATPYNMRIKIKGTPETWYKFDGVNQTMPVLSDKERGAKKAAGGDDQHYIMKQLMLRQAGVLST